MRNVDLAYAAGYTDGDGCFHIGKRGNKSIVHFIITSTDRDVLIWFQKIFKGSISSAKKVTEKTKFHRTLYQFSLKKMLGIEFAQSVHPYLVEKREEAQLFIDFANLSNNDEQIASIGRMKVLKKHTNLVLASHKTEFEALKNTIFPCLEDFAYLAGFMDAECSFGIQRYRTKNKPNPIFKGYLACNNSKAPVFKWLVQRFGGQIHFIDRSSYRSNHRNQLAWRVSSAALAKILKAIYPFLKHKNPVCGEMIKFYDLTLKNGGARHTHEFREAYAENIKKREEIVDRVHALNKKGK
jgi:hypothetical protein